MKIQQIQQITEATIVCGTEQQDRVTTCAFASDLMSDVLTLDCSGVLLITGLCNLQTIRTAEMAEIAYILFVIIGACSLISFLVSSKKEKDA